MNLIIFLRGHSKISYEGTLVYLINVLHILFFFETFLTDFNVSKYIYQNIFKFFIYGFLDLDYLSFGKNMLI